MNEKTPIIDKSKRESIQLQLAHNSDEDDFFPHNPFAETFDKQFWIDVSTLNKESYDGKNWSCALTKTRLDRLRDRSDESDKDVVLYILDIYDRFLQIANERNERDYLLSLVQQVSEFISMILIEDHEKNKTKKRTTYSVPLELNDDIEKTVLHLAAERNLEVIVKQVLTFYPRQCYRKCQCEEDREHLAIELALQNRMDDTASVLAEHMTNESVRALFEYDEVKKSVKFSFSELATDSTMKRTIFAVLDCLINPEFPFTPINPDDKNEDPWSKIPNKPQRYHVFYRLLDGDSSGKPAKNMDGRYNQDFEHRSKSGLYSVAHSPFCEDIIVHPAVRLLMNRKWEKYASRSIGIRIAIFVSFLICMTLAFFLPVKDGDRRRYETRDDKIRMLFEIITFGLNCIYGFYEIDQIKKDGVFYWKDPFNYFDISGICLIWAILPLKFIVVPHHPSTIEWSVASVAFLINVLRIFQWFPAISQLGLFIVVIKNLLSGIGKFLAVYFVLFVAFTGSIILALKSTTTGFSNAGINISSVVLKEVRALVETNPFADDYIGSYRAGVIILLMLNMFACILLMANILIAHLSNAFTEAELSAKIQCHIDRTIIVSRLENSYFRSMNQRMKNYVDAAYISDAREVSEMMKHWKEVKAKALNL